MGLIALVVGAVLVGTWLIEQHLSSSQSATSGLTDMLANIFAGPPVGMFSGGVGPLAQGMVVELQVYQSKPGLFGAVPDETKPRTVTALLGAPSDTAGCFAWAVLTSDSPTFPVGTTGGAWPTGVGAYPPACPPNVRRIVTQPSGGLIPAPIPVSQ